MDKHNFAVIYSGGKKNGTISISLGKKHLMILDERILCLFFIIISH